MLAAGRQKKRDGNDAVGGVRNLRDWASAQLPLCAERLTVLQRIDAAVAPLLRTDEDTIILGDFNTMGDGTPAQALREVLSIAELPPLVSPEREEVEPTAA